MAKYLRKSDVRAIEDVINSALDYMNDRQLRGWDIYPALQKCYDNFDEQSNTSATLAECRELIGVFDGMFAKTLSNRLDNIITTGIRVQNYPSHWRMTETQPRDQYRAGNPAPAMPGFWLCPRPNGSHLAAHPAANADCTIEHVNPVVWHWNNHGYNQSKVQRENWYWDTNNHEYLCQACNSSKGGGGLVYQIVTGPNYTN